MRTFFKNLRKYMPDTYFGFPVDQDWNLPAADRNAPRRGVALIIAIMAVAMIMIFSSNMIVTSAVNLELAVSHRDNVKAEYMAKSGENMAVFALMADWAFDLFKFSGQMGSKETPTDSNSDFWAVLNGLPIGGDTLEMLGAAQTQFDLNATNDAEVIDTLKLFDGEFVLNIEDEASKVNITKCVLSKCKDVTTFLEAMMSCPSEKMFLEKKNLAPQQVAMRIKDWLDENNTPEDTGFGTEDDPYEKKIPPYTSKNAPMESVNELRLIEGWDEEMHTVFSRYITIYPFLKQQSEAEAAQINLNTAPKEMLACLFPNAKSDCAEKFYKKLIERDEDGVAFASDRSSVKKFLSDDLCQGSSGGDSPSDDDKSGWFTYRSNVFRVKSKGQVGLQEKELEMVVERSVPDKAKKIETSFKVLYWKMI